MNTIAIGKLGESHAEKFLISRNYLIIANNFHCRFGEIDIVAIDLGQPRHELVFIEVKTRTSELFGTPEESISYQKLSKIFKTAIHFLNSSTKNLPRIWRIDAIAVKLDGNLHFEEIKHFKNISHGS
jgi:putative endonuclease